MSAFSIGLSALQVSQQLLKIAGQNIANAGTPGYHRQVASLAELETGQSIGAGVTITGVGREVSQPLETALLNNAFEGQAISTQLSNLQQIESYLAPGAGGAGDQLSQFFNQIKQLAANPGDQAQRSVVVNTASNLAQTLNATSNQLLQTTANLDAAGADLVGKINQAAKQIADLNGRIERATTAGQQPNDLLDQRDQLIANVAQLVDVRVIPTSFNEVTIMAAGAPIVAGTQSLDLQYQVGANNQAMLLRASQSAQALIPTGGQVAGLLQVRNGDLPRIRGQLDALTTALVQGVDEIQATGLGLTGPLTRASGTRAVSDPTANLNAAGLAFPPQAGDLFVSITDPTGTRTLHKITIDPTGATAGVAHSLNDVANALNALTVGTAHPLTASVAGNGTLQVTAASGYGFDFAGRLPTNPVNVQGNIAAQIGGNYAGTANDTYTYQVSYSGSASPPYTVGVTPGLSLNVYDGSNKLLGSFNVGQGYRPGTTLPAVNGVTVSLGAGTLQGTESFQVPVTANPDTGNLLTALGLNTLFTGSTASTLGVRPDLLTNPELLGGSHTGDGGDGSNFARIADLQDARTLANGTQTLGGYFASLVGQVGVRVQDLTGQQTAQQALGQQLTSQQQAVSGIDPNEELTNLLTYQRSFQMASEYINVINQSMTTLMGIIPINSAG
jgi:flagellar hook-associated protein FlgK